MNSPVLRRTARLASRVLGSRAVAAVARLANSDRLPVLAYHDVPNAAIFSRHLDLIQQWYRPVSGNEVAAAVRRDARLPRHAVWLSFDDANPGVFANALPQLADRKVPATLFACPGVVDTDRPYWWQSIELALTAGRGVVLRGKTWSDPSVITLLKTVPDAMRRTTVARVMDDLAASGLPPRADQATSDDLRRWLAAGLDIGNHTWDHPCLDTCDADQQREQIVTAHDWLRGLLGEPPRLFAYPNGNTAEPSRRVLADLGYNVATLFDHRLSRLRGREVSRLRIDADASERRLAAIVSGAHPAVYAVAPRIPGARGVQGGPR